MDNYKG